MEQLTDLAQKGVFKIVTSALTITEVLKGPNANSPNEEQAELILSYFDNEYIELRPVDVQVASYAANLRRQFKSLKTADAIHVATAHLAAAKVLQTYDYADLLKRDGLMCNPPLPIKEPAHPESCPLFDQQIATVEGSVSTENYGILDDAGDADDPSQPDSEAY